MDTNNMYLDPVKYNMVRLLNRMAEKIEEQGGVVLTDNKKKKVHTRGYTYRIRDATSEIGALTGEYFKHPRNSPESRNILDSYGKLEEELTTLSQKQDDAPVVATVLLNNGDLGIEFLLGDHRYTFYCESNPFYSDTFTKVPYGKDERVYRRDEIVCGEKFYYTDDMYQPVASTETIEYGAEKLLDFLKDRCISRLYA